MKSIPFALFTIGLFSSCSHSFPMDRQVAGDESIPSVLYIRDKDLPEPQAFLGWRNSSQELGSDAKGPEGYTPRDFHCAGPLAPTHPQQFTKKYHRSQWGPYDHFKLEGESALCTIRGSTRNPQGTLRCMRADFLKYAVLSDLFFNACGELVRGFWEVRFQKTKETDSSFASLGRTLRAKSDASGLKDLEEGPTHLVPMESFLFLTLPEPKDEERLNLARSQALANGWTVDSEVKTWVPPVNRPPSP